MIRTSAQTQPMPALDQLIHPKDIYGLFKAFLLSCKVDELSPATIRDYNQKIGAFTRFCQQYGIGGPGDITANVVRAFLLKVQETNCAISCGDYYRNIKRFLNWLVAEGMLERNPMSVIKPPRVPKKVIQPLTSQHISRLLQLCDDSKFLGVRNKAIILILLDTGLRLKELANIQIQDIDLDKETIKVMGKGAKERVVRMCSRTQKALLTYLLRRTDDFPCLWVSEERTPLTIWGIAIAINTLAKRAGITGIRCSAHSFRHTFATMVLKNGGNVYDLQNLLGHSTLDMVKRYVSSMTSENAIQGHKRFSPVDNLKL